MQDIKGYDEEEYTVTPLLERTAHRLKGGLREPVEGSFRADA